MNEPRQLAKVLADSLSPHKVRLTTMEVVMPRIVLAEFNTHRQLSRNSASSRAIPIEKMLQRVESDPYIPETWDRNGAGMQGHGAIEGDEAIDCDDAWLLARDKAIDGAKELLHLNVHKQWANRLLEPFMWHTVICSATEWSNFFHLRCHPAAHPAIRNTAEAMREAMAASTPRKLEFGEWHLPLVDERDANVRRAEKLSVARCARVSYLTHDGVRDPAKDIELHDSLLAAGHMSPFEHVARPMNMHDVADSLSKFRGVAVNRTQVDPSQHFSGNFRGWVQYRKTIAGEADILAHRNETAC
jgi:thymidylate synthase ThyX